MGDNIGLTASTPVIIKFYDGNELLGETKPPLDLTSAVKGIDAIGDMSESIFDKDEWVSKHDTDGDGIMNSEDDFSTYANADGSSPVSLSISYDECSSATKNKIKLTPQKTIDPVTTTNSYQILIDLPEFGSIKDDADGKTITSTEEYTFACEEKNTESSAEKSVPLWGGTVKGFKLSYTCTIDGDLKGNEKIPVSFLYEYTDKDGSEPSTCLFTLGKGKEVNLASSVIPTPIGGGGSSDASGGDCSLNVAASTHGFGWLVDMLVLGLPAVLVGRRRNKIQ